MSEPGAPTSSARSAFPRQGGPLAPVDSPPLDADGTVVVVGASLAGLRAAEEVRRRGHRGPVVVVGEERHDPYDRPPLSKQVLAGTWDVERIRHHAPEALGELGIELLLGRRAVALDLDGRAVELDGGHRYPFDGLVVATGASPRRLPDTEGLAAVHVLRTLDDCVAIRRDLLAAGTGGHLVVVGSGFIGSEVASTAHALGARVTVVEALATPLAGALGVEMGRACAGLHTDAGVDLRTGVGVDRIAPAERSGAGPPGRSAASSPVGVHLADGSVLEADVVVVGIGVTPATEWLDGSGLELADGVRVTSRLFAAPGVVAAGDVARWPLPSAGGEVRIEHWTNAAEGGVAAGRNLVAGSAAAEPYEPVPFFWSDQYGTKIQLVGHPDPTDEAVVVDGAIDDRRFVALYRRGDRVSAALALSRPRQLMQFRPLVAAGASFDEALVLARH